MRLTKIVKRTNNSSSLAVEETTQIGVITFKYIDKLISYMYKKVLFIIKS